MLIYGGSSRKMITNCSPSSSYEHKIGRRPAASFPQAQPRWSERGSFGPQVCMHPIGQPCPCMKTQGLFGINDEELRTHQLFQLS